MSRTNSSYTRNKYNLETKQKDISRQSELETEETMVSEQTEKVVSDKKSD